MITTPNSDAQFTTWRQTTSQTFMSRPSGAHKCFPSENGATPVMVCGLYGKTKKTKQGEEVLLT